MKKFLLVFMVLLVLTGNTALAKEYKYISYDYTVEYGDTLDNVAEKFMVRNTYGTRNFMEFRQGIIEANSSLWENPSRDLVKGEILHVSWWEKDECE